jgi:hypothetical protein
MCVTIKFSNVDMSATSELQSFIPNGILIAYYSAFGKSVHLGYGTVRFRPVSTLVDITSNSFYKCTATFRTPCMYTEGCNSMDTIIRRHTGSIYFVYELISGLEIIKIT